MFPGPMSDLTLRWVVTLLFVASIATYVCILIVDHRRWTNTVNHSLHLAMSAAMILMAWDVGMHLPALGIMAFLNNVVVPRIGLRCF